MNSLNVLHLEDNPTDAELIKNILEEEGLCCDITLVEDEDQFTASLTGKSYDLILADYTLPTFDGISALKIVSKRFPLIPVILVSGTVGEEVAIESLKSGATDYVLKTRLTRLIPSVKRAIKETEERAMRLQLEKQLQQAQKMEAIGTLAGGIAHDFNNILAAVLGYGELALEDVKGNTQLTSYLESILRAGNRATMLVRQILAFSRKAEQECISMRMQPVVKEVLKLLRATLPATIEIQKDIEPGCGPVFADPTQIHQVLMNLCTNSFHAMRENGGVLKIQLSTSEITDPDGAIPACSKASHRWLKLTVTDNGCGMDQETLKKMYDPYFTTKKKGEGTGLGMSVVHGIIASIGGSIKAESEIGKGSIIQIRIPLDDSTTDVSHEITSPENIIGGKERVLVVDDEAELALMLQRMLARLGYQVTIFTDPEVALNLMKNDPASVDIVITDMAMPNLSGAQLAAELLNINPMLPIILCSGYSENLDRHKAMEMGIREYLLKPVNRKTLGEAVRNALDHK